MARIVPAVRGMYIALTLHLLWTLGAAAVITRRQRIPASAAAWLALVFLLPVAGTLLYVLAGYRRAVPAAEPCDCRGDAVEQIVARGCGTRPAPRNSVSLLHNGSNAFTALIAALQNGEIHAAGLDVFEHEPLAKDSPLLSLPNVVALPHIGSATHETRYNMAACAVDNLIDALNGNVEKNCVNPQVK